MSATETITGLEGLTLLIERETFVNASVEDTFESLLEELGPGGTRRDGTPMDMKIEPWPGGRWYRDLGNNNGHWWANVQAIKRPTLLEFSGPLFMSYGVVSNVQYRLSEANGGTLIKFHHKAFGAIQEDHRQGVGGGWNHFLEGVRKRAEAKRK